MTEQTKQLLETLAKKYETKEFMENDPSGFIHGYKGKNQQEIVCFVASCLSFGSRVQFCKKIQSILSSMKEMQQTPLSWVLQKKYMQFFLQDEKSFYEKSFYRMYTNKDMIDLFDRLRNIIYQYGSLEECIKGLWQTKRFAYLQDTFSFAFKGCKIVSSSASSCKKRLCLFLRWMVRKNSPVDLGLWTWFPQKDLIIPLDVHVMRQARKLGLTKRNTPSAKTALEITQELKEVWEDDPTKGDFALFGFGVS